MQRSSDWNEFALSTDERKTKVKEHGERGASDTTEAGGTDFVN